jgi:hypothetical protein
MSTAGLPLTASTENRLKTKWSSITHRLSKLDCGSVQAPHPCLESSTTIGRCDPQGVLVAIVVNQPLPTNTTIVFQSTSSSTHTSINSGRLTNTQPNSEVAADWWIVDAQWLNDGALFAVVRISCYHSLDKLTTTCQHFGSSASSFRPFSQGSTNLANMT